MFYSLFRLNFRSSLKLYKRLNLDHIEHTNLHLWFHSRHTANSTLVSYRDWEVLVSVLQLPHAWAGEESTATCDLWSHLQYRLVLLLQKRSSVPSVQWGCAMIGMIWGSTWEWGPQSVLTNKPPGCLVVENLPTSAADLRDTGSIPESERSPGEGLGQPLPSSGLENPMNRVSWRTGSHRVRHDWSGLAHTHTSLTSWDVTFCCSKSKFVSWSV